MKGVVIRYKVHSWGFKGIYTSGAKLDVSDRSFPPNSATKYDMFLKTHMN